MPLKDEEKSAIAEVVEELTSTVVGSGRGKRRIADLFEELVDKESYPDYYEVLPLYLTSFVLSKYMRASV